MPGKASLAAEISSLAVCFFPNGTCAERSSPARGPVIFSGMSVIVVTFPLSPCVSKITSLASERLRPSTVNVTVFPRSMPAGEILAMVGGIIGTWLRAHMGSVSPKRTRRTSRAVRVFTLPPTGHSAFSVGRVWGAEDRRGRSRLFVSVDVVETEGAIVAARGKPLTVGADGEGLHPIGLLIYDT